MDAADTQSPDLWIRRRLPRNVRVNLLVASAAAAVAIILAGEAADAPMSYYRFAGNWRALGIPNFLNVISNLPFLLVGVMGLVFVAGPRGRALLAAPVERWCYLVFFAGVTLTTFGSAFFHLEPLFADGTLNAFAMLCDRLPITVAFMALFAAFIADRVNTRAGAIRLPLLVALGIASCLYWYMTYQPGGGDLRPYALVQVYPALAIPLVTWLFAGRVTHGLYVAWTLALYGAAKLVENYDGAVYALLGETLSGHVIKHLLAAVAAYMVLAMLRHTARSAAPAARTPESK